MMYVYIRKNTLLLERSGIFSDKDKWEGLSDKKQLVSRAYRLKNWTIFSALVGHALDNKAERVTIYI